MAEWHSIDFSRNAQVIPPLCPSCLASAAMPVRTTHLFLNQRYTQTFYYCEPCGKQTESAPSLFFSALIGLLLGAFAGNAFALGMYSKLSEAMKSNSVVNALPLIMMVSGAVGLPWWRRRSALRRFPLREGQAAWGPAAYYVGTPGFGFGGGARYKALRPEWIREFVRLNADQADAATCGRWGVSPG